MEIQKNDAISQLNVMGSKLEEIYNKNCLTSGDFCELLKQKEKLNLIISGTSQIEDEQGLLDKYFEVVNNLFEKIEIQQQSSKNNSLEELNFFYDNTHLGYIPGLGEYFALNT